MYHQELPEKAVCPEIDTDLEFAQSSWMQEGNQTAQDHWANYRHLHDEMIHDFCPVDKAKGQ